MMKIRENINAWQLREMRKRMSGEEFVNGLSDHMVRELRETKSSEIMLEIVENIREACLYHEVKAIVYTACKLNDQVGALSDQRAAVQRELQKARAEAESIRLAAQQEAQKLRADAQQDLHRRYAQFKEYTQRERTQAMESARAEAEAVRCQMIEKARIEASEVYRELRDRFVPTAVTEAIDSYRREDSAAGAAFAEQHRRNVAAFEDTRSRLSGEMTGLQAQLSEQLSEMQNCISRSMVDWREQLYRLETMDLAQCAVNLSTILSGVDKRIAEAAGQEDVRTVEALTSVRRNLSRFEKQYKNALNAVGLQVYQPQPGETFDPARHVLGDSGKDVDPDQPLTVVDCVRPGVLGSAGNAVEALIRAEVAAENAVRPRFSQIVPGGDQE